MQVLGLNLCPLEEQAPLLTVELRLQPLFIHYACFCLIQFPRDIYCRKKDTKQKKKKKKKKKGGGSLGAMWLMHLIEEVETGGIWGWPTRLDQSASSRTNERDTWSQKYKVAAPEDWEPAFSPGLCMHMCTPFLVSACMCAHHF